MIVRLFFSLMFFFVFSSPRFLVKTAVTAVNTAATAVKVTAVLTAVTAVYTAVTFLCKKLFFDFRRLTKIKI